MNIAIFASGSGTNAENITRFFDASADHAVTLILTDNPSAGVLERAKNLQVPALVFTKEQLANGHVLDVLQNQSIDFVVLAGFLRLVPSEIIAAYPNKIVNIHPALLPKFGGKGMYGMHVHKAVKEAGESETGITIHYVNENYDDGAIIRQESVAITPKDSAADIQAKVQKLEHTYFAAVISSLLENEE